MRMKKLLFCLLFGAIHCSYPMEDATASATSKMLSENELFNWVKQNNIEKLETFFAGNEWQMHHYKKYMLEILLQHAIGQYNNLKIVQYLFDHGAKIDIQKRATKPKDFEYYSRYKPQDLDSYWHPRSNNIFHFWFTRQSVDLCKLLLKQTILEQIGKAIKGKCINTFTLCMHRQKADGTACFSKDIRNLLQRYLLNIPSDEFVASSKLNAEYDELVGSSQLNAQYFAKITALSCEQICPFLKIVLETKCEKNKRPYDHIGLRKNIRGKLMPDEENLMKLLDPERVHATVSEMAHEMYPELDLSIADPNASLLSKAMNGVSRLFGTNQ